MEFDVANERLNAAIAKDKEVVAQPYYLDLMHAQSQIGILIFVWF